MRTMTWLGALCTAGAVAATACGNGAGTTAGTGGTGGQATKTTTGAGGAGGVDGTGGAGGGSALVNGCDPSTAEDHTTDGTAMVMFPQGGLKYSPACMKIKVGEGVMFMGDLAAHPLRAGEIKNGKPVPDTKSPILSTDKGMMVTFKFPAAGTYGYYCNNHEPSMVGVVFVE